MEVKTKMEAGTNTGVGLINKYPLIKSTDYKEKTYYIDSVFRKIFALIVIFFSAFFIYKAAFTPVETLNKEIVNTVIGFILGTAVTTIIAFYFGSSQSSQNKDL